MYIYLLRHAEAESGMYNPDKKRKLSKAGIDDAHLLNKFILVKDLRFDLVLSSSSTRTRETTEIILKDVRCDKDPDYLDELYQASENTISNIILKNSTKNTLIVSHNPSLSQTISSLRKEEFKNYPTCTFGCFFRKESDDDFVNTILINSANGKIIDL
tara:strand:+ start:28079 stop:28552 length:474 start_codon:yes stop_codon:yes gene_type:complete